MIRYYHTAWWDIAFMIHWLDTAFITQWIIQPLWCNDEIGVAQPLFCGTESHSTSPWQTVCLQLYCLGQLSLLFSVDRYSKISPALCTVLTSWRAFSLKWCGDSFTVLLHQMVKCTALLESFSPPVHATYTAQLACAADKFTLTCWGSLGGQIMMMVKRTTFRNDLTQQLSTPTQPFSNLASLSTIGWADTTGWVKKK